MIRRHGKVFLLFSVVICIVLIVLWRTQYRKEENDPVYASLKEVLQQGEVLVDYKKDGSRIYALVSRERRKNYGDLLVILQQNEKRMWERRYENDFTGLKPWKIETADIDGDKEREILIAVLKTTHYDDAEKNRMFIFNYKDVLVKKWTGSKIAGIWKMFYSGDLTDRKGEELIFIQKTPEGKERLLVYYWFDFGFFLLAEGEDYQEIKHISLTEDKKIELTYRDGTKTGTSTLVIKNGKISEVKD